MTSDWNTEAVTSEADTAHRHNAVQEIFLVHIDHHTISIINTSYGLQTDISILRVGLSMMTMSNKLKSFTFYDLYFTLWAGPGWAAIFSLHQALIDQITAKYLQYPLASPAH